MNLQILQENLKEGLKIVERIASKSLALPILNNILISAEKNFLNLAATDLEMGINWWSLAKIEKEGKVTIPSHLLSGFINLLSNEKISIKSENNNLSVVCKNSKTQLKGISAEEFPIIPTIKDGEFININNIIFCQGLKQVSDIPIPSTTRPEISGVYISFKKNQIIMTATDSFRLGEKKITLKTANSLKKEYSLIIPQKTIKEIINIFENKEGEVKIYFSSNQIMAEYLMPETSHPQIQVVSRLIDGEYPDYQKIIPEKFSTEVILDKNEFLNQIKSASLFAGKTSEIRIKTKLESKELIVFSQSQEVGEYESSLPAKIKGEETEIVFNHKFLSDGINNIKSSEIILGLNGESGPGVLKPVGDESYLYVVMPIKN